MKTIHFILTAMAASLLPTLQAEQTEQENATDKQKEHAQNQQKLSGGAILLRSFITNNEPVVLVKLKYTTQAPFVREDGERGAWALTVGEIVGGVRTDIPKGTKVLCEIPYSPEDKKIEPYIIMSLVGHKNITKVFDDENMIYLGGVPFYDVYGSYLSELIRSGFPTPEPWQKLHQIITSTN